MNLNEIDWDLESAGQWPAAIKALVIGFASLVITVAWFYYDTQAQLSQLEQIQQQEDEFRRQFELTQKKSANLGEYKAQQAEMERIFGDMLRQLPNKTQIPELLVDVSQTGLASGLEFELFRPGQEERKDFYAELPIDIRVVGSYEKFGLFISGLAALPRIVTVHNLKIKSREGTQSKNEPILTLETQVRTYRYLDDSEVRLSKPATK